MRFCDVLRRGKPYSKVPCLASPHKLKHPGYSCILNMPTNNEILPIDRLWRVQNILWRQKHIPYMMGLGQGNRAAPPSWIQLSVVLVKVFKQLKLGAIINDPISKTLIHSMEVLFMDDSDIYTLRENISNPGELRKQA